MPKIPLNSAIPPLFGPESARNLLMRGDLLGAEAKAWELLRTSSGHEDLHLEIGLALSRQLMPRLALPHLQRAAARRQADSGVLRTYGAALLDAGELDQARSTLKAVTRTRADDFLAHALLGRLNAALDHRDHAERCFLKAIALAPVPRKGDFENQLLDLRLSWGDLDSIAAELESSVNAGTATPHQLACFIRLRTPDETSAAARLLDERIASPDLAQESLAELLHAKASVLEKSGKFDEAFTLLLAAKSRQPNRFLPEDFEVYVEQMLAVMSNPAIADIAARIGDNAFAPIFIAGAPRSGTTLADQILSAHGKVGSAGEAGPLREVLILLTRYTSGHGESLAASMARAGFDRLVRLRDGIRIALQNRAGGAPIVVEKTPQNYMTVHLILALFPRARIIHCYRDPADNFVSSFRLNMGPDHGYTRSPQAYARFYMSYARLMRHWHREFPGRLFALEYEALVKDPEPEIRAMLQFLELPWDPACLEPHRNAARVTTPSMFQVRQPINPRSVGSARRYAARIGDLFSPAESFAVRG